MTVTEAAFLGFICIYVRCSAMLLSSPFFGSHSIPTSIRVYVCLAISAAMTGFVNIHSVAVPTTLFGLLFLLGTQVAIGLLIGNLVNLVLVAAQIAGGLLDFQVGLNNGQLLNPTDGSSVTVLQQFKSMLSTVLFLVCGGYQVLFHQFIASFDATVDLSPSRLTPVVVNLLGTICIVALQIAAPVVAVSFLADAGLALISKAVPQMPAMMVGTPAKIAVCMVAVTLALPLVATGMIHGLDAANSAVSLIFQR